MLQKKYLMYGMSDILVDARNRFVCSFFSRRLSSGYEFISSFKKPNYSIEIVEVSIWIAFLLVVFNKYTS